MIVAWIDTLGAKTIKGSIRAFDIFRFAWVILSHLVRPSSYNPAMRSVIVKQIYFTAVEIIPMFMIIAVVFGSVIIGVVISFAATYNLQAHIGSIIITFVMNEFAPFFTALLIALRSGTAINTEIAVMHVNNELNALKAYGIDIIDYLFLPRIIGGMMSITLLSLMFAIIMIASGYLFTLFYMDMHINTYKRLLIDAVGGVDILIQIGKSLLFGFVTISIPLYSGLKTGTSYTAIPISVLRGMVRLFLTLFFIEVLSLQLQSL
ncbi:MAG: ABC transporter permease [Campylobacterales bacterium]|nr:ABC transporter permease [Campylobacterales bacterium]